MTLYWIVQYIVVFCGYLLLMFAWPSIVFHEHLRGKGKRYRFGFCVTVQVVLVNTVVLVLGLCHALTQWTVMIVFYGLLIWGILRRFPPTAATLDRIQKLLAGVYGSKKFVLFQLAGLAFRGFKGLCRRLWEMARPRLAEYIFLCASLVAGILYFSYNSFQNYSYGASDILVHHQWIYGLMEGDVFSAGVYPEGMHCFLYCLHALLGVPVYSALLFIGGIHVITLLLAVYFLLRELFRWRYAPFLVLAIFLVMDVPSKFIVMNLARLQSALPQEFGLYTPFLCAMFLMRYLKGAHHATYRNRVSKYFWDENLFLFMMAFTASVAIHFYPTVMAFFFCAAVGICAIKRLFTRERLVPIAATVLCGLFIAGAPMMGALLSGIPPQGSLYWGVNVFAAEGDQEQATMDEAGGAGDVKESEQAQKAAQGKKTANPFQVAGSVLKSYWKGCVWLYGSVYGNALAAIIGLTILLWIAHQAVCREHGKPRRIPPGPGWLEKLRRIPPGLGWLKKLSREQVHRYMMLVLALFFLVAQYMASETGLVQLIPSNRIALVIHVLAIAIAVVPLDVTFTLLEAVPMDGSLRLLRHQGVSVACILFVCGLTICFGGYRGILPTSLLRYNAAAVTTDKIIGEFPKDSFTLVSPTDELYQVIQYGGHEELLDFVNRTSEEEEYFIQTDYVFLYVEKKPILYDQILFYKGPFWMGTEKYAELFSDEMHLFTIGEDTGTEKYAELLREKTNGDGTDILASEISETAAEQELPDLNAWEMYTDLDARTIIESKAYAWCQQFAEIHPLEMNVYYEDDDFVCYYFEQEKTSPYNLAIE